MVTSSSTSYSGIVLSVHTVPSALEAEYYDEVTL